jgi:TPR repeat protein
LALRPCRNLRWAKHRRQIRRPRRHPVFQAGTMIWGPPPAGLSPNLLRHGKNAQRGKTEALFNLAWSSSNGRGGLPKDDKEAARLYKLAADQGNAAAQAHLGPMDANGRGGLPKDDKEALRRYKLAAQQGNDWAQNRLRELGQKW